MLARSTWRLGACCALASSLALEPTVALASALEASASETELGLLPARTKGDIPKYIAAGLRSDLLQGLRRGRDDVRDLGVAPPSPNGCEDAQCFQRLASESDVPFLVDAELSRTGRDYHLQLRLVQGSSGKTMADVGEDCEICSAQEVRAMVVDTAAALGLRFESLRAAAASIVVTGEPAGARVYIDGELAGRTPFESNVSAGSHTLRLEQPGYQAQERTLDAVAGIRDVIDYSLVVERPAPGDPGATEQSRQADRVGLHPAWGWSSLGVGLAALGTGAALIAIDEQPVEGSCDTANPADAQGQCPRRYDTLAAGASLAAIGSAAVVAGVVLTVLSYRTRRTRRVDVSASPLSVSVSGSF